MIRNGGVPLRKSDLKEKNEKMVLSLIRQAGTITQSEIAQLTGLKPPTILRIFNTLDSQKLIRVCEGNAPPAERRGRKPVWYQVNPEAFYLVGVDFFALLVSVVVQNFNGGSVASVVMDLPSGLEVTQIAYEVKRAVWRALDEAGVGQHDILGIGIGSPGVVDTLNGKVVFYSRIKGMRHYDIRSDFESSFKVPVIVHNNCSVIAQSEYLYGPAKGADSIIMFLIRGGLGGAYVQHGKAYINQNRTAFEMGHIMVDYEISPGEGGENASLERWITENALVECGASADPSIADIDGLDRVLGSGSEAVSLALRKPADMLARTVLTLSNILNPEAFIFVSRSKHCAEFLARECGDFHSQYSYTSTDQKIAFHGRLYDPKLACKGAVDLVLSAYFEGNIGFSGSTGGYNES